MISLDELKKELVAIRVPYDTLSGEALKRALLFNDGVNAALAIALDMPAATKADQGRWIADEEYDFMGEPIARCSKCERLVIGESSFRYEFCPHCGRPMKPYDGDDKKRRGRSK